MTAFQKIYEAAIEGAPQLAPRNTHVIHEWIAAGYDLEQDILPAIEESLKRGGRTIFSFGFFTAGIQRNHEKRIKMRQQVTPKGKEDAEVVRAKNIKWHKVRGLCSTKLGPSDYDWLAHYEQQHGEVAV